MSSMGGGHHRLHPQNGRAAREARTAAGRRAQLNRELVASRQRLRAYHAAIREANALRDEDTAMARALDAMAELEIQSDLDRQMEALP